jgi:hypothetical protein
MPHQMRPGSSRGAITFAQLMYSKQEGGVTHVQKEDGSEMLPPVSVPIFEN